MCCNKSWPLWLGVVGLIVGVAVVRHTHHLRAQPPQPPQPPAEVGQRPVGPVGPLGPGRLQAPQLADGKDVNVNVAVRNNTIPGKVAPKGELDTEVEGYGLKPDDAYKDAVEAGRKAVESYLANKYGESYMPSADELNSKHIVSLLAEPEPANTPLTNEVSNSRMLKAVVTVKLNSDQVKELRNAARQERAVGRLKTTGFGLIGLVALLLIGGGYLRMEEATKGYYTTLLRVAALGLVAALAAVGIYLLGS